MTARELPRIWREYGAIALRAGWKIVATNGGHYQWKPPNGGPIIVTSKTPSDQRTLYNVRAQLRRSGLEI